MDVSDVLLFGTHIHHKGLKNKIKIKNYYIIFTFNMQ